MLTPKSKKFDKLVSALRSFVQLRDEARVAKNAENRGKTQAKKAFKAFVAENDFPAKSAVIVDGLAFSWETSVSEVIDPRKWYNMWKIGEIDEDSFFSALSVRKDDAKKFIGEDQVTTISYMSNGTAADIRVKEVSAKQDAPYVELPTRVRTVPLMKRRSPQPIAEPDKPIGTRKPTRLLKLRK